MKCWDCHIVSLSVCNLIMMLAQNVWYSQEKIWEEGRMKREEQLLNLLKWKCYKTTSIDLKKWQDGKIFCPWLLLHKSISIKNEYNSYLALCYLGAKWGITKLSLLLFAACFAGRWTTYHSFVKRINPLDKVDMVK